MENSEELSTVIDNLELQQALDIVNNTGLSIFLSGKAGTGKTTFLRSLAKLTYKKFLIIAPTGVAAVNAGGLTIHSLFQLAPGVLYTPTDKSAYGNRLNAERKKLVQNLDLLVIDEVSMLRADTLDLINSILKNVRASEKVFGGVQVLFVGDLYQLPPVCSKEEWNVLVKFYKSPYFVDARSFSVASPILIELNRVYRQKDQLFVDMLNAVRANSISAQQKGLLNSLVHQKPANADMVTLTTHNDLADNINTTCLDRLAGNALQVKAIIDGDFDPTSVVAEVNLVLKMGAPVMLIRNHQQGDTLYYNGKIGVLESIDAGSVKITKVIWQNFDYEFDDTSQSVRSQVSGTFEQFPVRLAWAITIHKSQGLTFDRAVIDVAKAFAAGQIYVALSRLRTIEGLSLSAQISAEQLKVDPRITEFFEAYIDITGPLMPKIDSAKAEYLKAQLTSWFDLGGLAVDFAQPGANAKTAAIIDSLRKLDGQAKKFARELSSIFSLNQNERCVKLAERVPAAVNYFENQLTGISKEAQQLIKNCGDGVLYKKVISFFKRVRQEIAKKQNQLSLAKRVGESIGATQDLGQIFLD